MKRLMFALCMVVTVTSNSYGADVGGWGLWSLANGGFGAGSHPGGALVGNAVELAFGFSGLHSLGFGIKAYEVVESPQRRGLKTSYFKSVAPVYVYYPLFSSQPRIARKDLRPIRDRFGYLFMGGSGWGETANYVHCGVAMTLGTAFLNTSSASGNPGDVIYDFYTYGLQVGGCRSFDWQQGSRTTKGDWGAYAALTVGVGSAVAP